MLHSNAPMGPGWRSSIPALALAWLAGAALYAAWAVSQGQDANWDLQNYHDYTAYALLHGRHLRDVGPGGFQGYFNPLIYLLPYGLRAALPPLPAAVALAAVQAGAVATAWVLSGAVCSALPGHGRAVRACATLAGATGAMALSEAGTSFADLVLAIPVLGAAALIVRADGQRMRWLAWAGLLLGAATGLKLTNAVYAVGFGAAVLAPWPRRPVAAALAYGLGGVAGFALTGGAWAAMLAVKLGNPVFPALNSLFRSPSAVPADYAEARFLPKDLWDALGYPFQVAAGYHPTTEIPFADPRLAAAMVLSLVWLVRSRDRRMLRCLVAAWAAGALWLGVFAVQRYAVALEIMCGVLSVHLAVNLAARAQRPALVAGVAAAALVAGTRPADWWRRTWTDAYVPRPPAALQAPAAVLMAGQPLGYWVSALPDASRVFLVSPSSGLAVGGLLRERMAAGLRAPPGGRIWVMANDVPLAPDARAGLAQWGLSPAAPCHRAPSLWWVDTVFCRAIPGRDGVADFAHAFFELFRRRAWRRRHQPAENRLMREGAGPFFDRGRDRRPQSPVGRLVAREAVAHLRILRSIREHERNLMRDEIALREVFVRRHIGVSEPSACAECVGAVLADKARIGVKRVGGGAAPFVGLIDDERGFNLREMRLVGGEREPQRLVDREQQHEIARGVEGGPRAGKSLERLARAAERRNPPARAVPLQPLAGGGIVFRRACRGDCPVLCAQAIDIKESVVAVGHRAIAFAGLLSGCGLLRSGDDRAKNIPGEAFVGGGPDRHRLVGLVLVVVAAGFAVDQADEFAVHGLNAGQPVSAIRQRALAAGLQHRAFFPAHVYGRFAVDGIGAVIGREAAKAAIRKLDRDKRRVGFRARRPTHDFRRADADRQAFDAERGLLLCARSGEQAEAYEQCQKEKKERSMAGHDSGV